MFKNEHACIYNYCQQYSYIIMILYVICTSRNSVNKDNIFDINNLGNTNQNNTINLLSFIKY